MKKIMLIAGCSHAAGSEIDGTEDSKYNRDHSFGGLLARKLGYEPINIASNGGTNPTIARSVLEWFSSNYNKNEMEVVVLIAWTESSRIEIPVNRSCCYHMANPASDLQSSTDNFYLRINQGFMGGTPEEINIMPYYHKFIANHLEYLEILSVNYILQIQYFLKMHQINYIMCNTLHMFTQSNCLKFYIDQIDSSKYIDFNNNDNAFYWYYRNAGHENPKAKYWHHGEIPHKLYAEKLYTFIQNTESNSLTVP